MVLPPEYIQLQKNLARWGPFPSSHVRLMWPGHFCHLRADATPGLPVTDPYTGVQWPRCSPVGGAQWQLGLHTPVWALFPSTLGAVTM